MNTNHVNQTKAITVVVGAFCTSDFGRAPSFAAFEVTKDLLDKLAGLVKLCIDRELTSVSVEGAPSWGPGDIEEELGLQSPEITVLPNGSFWFADEPNYVAYKIETYLAELSAVQTAYDAADDGAVVFLTDDTSVNQQYLDDNREANAGGPSVK